MHIITRMQTRSGKTYATNSSSSKNKNNNIKLKMNVDTVDNCITFRMQTRSGKIYTASSSNMENNNIKLKMKDEKVEKVVNRTKEQGPRQRPTPMPISTHRIPTGFIIQPRKISNELAEFLGKQVGTEMLRTDVCRFINRYIRENKLQDPQFGCNINPDTKLRALLKLGENDELTYFNINKYMNHHFIQSRPSHVSTDRRPSGFIVPSKISDELAKFLGKPVGTLMSRVDVSSYINSYIRHNNLQYPRNGRRINPDTKLRDLLKSGENDEITYFNLQKYMKHHFIRKN